MPGRRNRILLTALVVPILIIAFIINVGPDNKYLSDSELFKKFILDPIPESVTDLRVNRPASYYFDPVYVMNFKINNNDIQTILKTKPFVEHGWWELDTHLGTLRWKYKYVIKDPLDETRTLDQGTKTDIVFLNKDKNGFVNPHWFRPVRYKKRFYAYQINRNPNNPIHVTNHVLIYDEELSETDYIRSVTCGL